MNKKKFTELKLKYLKHLAKGSDKKSEAERRELLEATVKRAESGKKFSARYNYH